MPTLILIGPAHPLRGGLASFNERLAREFQNRGWETKIITFSLQYPSFLFPGKTQYSVESKPADLHIEVKINSVNPFNWILQGWKLKKLKADLVVTRFWIPFMGPCLGTLLHLIRWNKHSRIVCIVDNLIPHEHRIGDRLLTRYFVKTPHSFICMSETVEAELLQMCPKAESQLVDHPVFDHFGPALDQQDARTILGLPLHAKIVLFFGFIRRYKGLDLLLKAMAFENVRKQDIHLLIAGEFYEPEEEYLQLIEELHIGNKIHLHKHFIPDSQVKQYFSACDLVVQPYRDATQSGVTPLAYFFEKPTLVTNVGSLARLVPEGKAGFVCSPSPDQIAEKMCSFFMMDPLPFSLFLKDEKKKLSWDHFAETIEKSAFQN